MSAVQLRYHTPHVAVITLSNPPVNTLSWESRAHLKTAIDRLEKDREVRAVVLTGAGGVFTAGADLLQDQRMSPTELPDFVADFERIVYGLERFRAPVIAAVNGPAVGGGLELALACDIRVASSEASFVAAGVNVGLMANFWRLARIVGLGPAKEILLTGERYGAERAAAWGLVTEVCAPEALMHVALAKAERIATRAPLSVEATKRCVNDAPEMSRDEAHRRQVDELSELFLKDDHKEALRAFFAKSSGEYHRH
ncbi:enoyl-CoA hydratase/isomerase family protein [Streptomyces sp. NPDC001970]